jgi:hypothetical protein
VYGIVFWAGFKSKGGNMIHKPVSIAGGLLIALTIFIVGAVVDAFITVWIFKKYGGCPINKTK